HHDHRYLHSFPTRRSSDLEPNPKKNFCDPFKVDSDGNQNWLTFVCNVSKNYNNYMLIYWNGRNHYELAGIRFNEKIVSVFPRSKDRKSTRLNSSHDQISYA